MTPQKIILLQRQSPGDYLTCLASLESLHIQYPNRFITGFKCVYPDLFLNHPLVTKLDERDPDVRVIEMHCPAISQSHVPIHFMTTWCEYLGEQLGLPLKLQVPHPTIYLSEQEKSLPRIYGSWVINAGYKEDCHAKHWGWGRYQQVVEMMPHITFVQVGESHHTHKPLRGKNVIDMLGKTDKDCRHLIRLCSQVDGGVGGVTFLQHVMAALRKPYVCINLREPKWFTEYPRQTTLTVQGKLECCKDRACWASAVAPGDHGTKCKLPVLNQDEWTGKCAELISPEQVVSAISSYGSSVL